MTHKQPGLARGSRMWPRLRRDAARLAKAVNRLTVVQEDRYRRRHRSNAAFLAKAGMCLSVVAALCMSMSGAAHAATNYGFASSNWQNGNAPEYQNYYNTSTFETLRADIGSPTNSPGGKPPKEGTTYQRFVVPYDTFATSNGTSCVQPTGQTGVAKIEAAVADAESSTGGTQIPLIALSGDIYSTDNGGYSATPPEWPTDQDLECATQYMEQDFLNYPAASGGPLIGTSTNFHTSSTPNGTGKPVLQIESINEPDTHGSPTNQCQPTVTPALSSNGAECAARYFADIVQENLATNGGADGHVIAGVFAGLGTSIPTNPSYAPSNCASKGDFMESYICFLQVGDSIPIPNGGTLQSYNMYATSWSFHDYTDMNNSLDGDCSSDYLDCVDTQFADFENTLSTWNEPTTDMWITEAGYDHVGSGGAYQLLTPQEEINGAADWLTIADGVLYGPPEHMFWAEYTTNSSDNFDSAVTDDSELRRPSYCELTGLAQSTCTGNPNNRPPAGSSSTEAGSARP